jgi:hypothetical protein
MNKKLATTGTNGNSLAVKLSSLNEYNVTESPAQKAVLQYMVMEVPITNMTVAAIRDTIIDAGRW